MSKLVSERVSERQTGKVRVKVSRRETGKLCKSRDITEGYTDKNK